MGTAAQPTTAARPLELTLRAVLIGIVLSVVMGAANVYLGLKAGMTVSASIPAAVVGMLILRGLFRTGTILEANQVQTGASAGESLSAGIIFTMPALILIGAWKEFDYLTTTVVALAGGLLGILFMIPMRRVFVVDNTELKYPEGVACAAVLRAGDRDAPGADEADVAEHSAGARAVIFGGLLGVVFKLGASFVGLLRSTLEGAMSLGAEAGSRVLYFGGDISPALVAVGFIVRLNVAVLIFIGGSLGWLIGIPLLDAPLGEGGAAPEPLDAAWGLWSTQIRYVGVGAMVVGGVASIYRVRGGLVRAVRELSKSIRRDERLPVDGTGAGSSSAAAPGVGERAPPAPPAETQRDLSGAAIGGLALVSTLLVFGTYYSLTGSLPITLITTLIMVVMSFFFTAVASYIVGLVGNSNSPVSGMTITAVLFCALLLYLLGFSGTEGMVATLGVAAIVCCAACTSGDVCNDLKTGSLVGASPRKQQIMEIVGVFFAALVMAPVLQLLHDNTPGGIGGRELSAPQAGLFASLVQGFFGGGTLPWNMVGIGAGLGVLILVVDFVLQRMKSPFRAHLMPIAVGIYLPFGLSVPILLGGVISWLLLRKEHQRRGSALTEDDEDTELRKGVLFSSGIIAGESLTGVGLAVLAAAGIQRLDLGLSDPITLVATSVAAASVPFLMWRAARRAKPA